MSRQEFIKSILNGRTDHFNFEGYCRIYRDMDMSRPIEFLTKYNYQAFWFQNYKIGDEYVIISRPEREISFCFSDWAMDYKLLDNGSYRVEVFVRDIPKTILVTEPLDLGALKEDLLGLVSGSKGSSKRFKYAS